MSIIVSALFLVGLGLCALLNLAAIPGNWIIAVLVVAWASFFREQTPPLSFFVLLVLFLLGSECVEFLAQMWGSKKYGSSRASTVASMAGAFFGALFCMPLFFGLGAIPGALAGAWGGCFLAEFFLERHPADEAVHAANGAFLGRLQGMAIKFGAGIGMVMLTAMHL
ncbi:MAG: DUF456 domain-containing protein [Mailhella sp.]|nr:DUF456 domain-containing protein [Mailhella sp.]